MLAEAVRTYPEDIRVAVLATGGLSHEPGGPRYFWVDEEFDRWFLDLLKRGDHATLLRECTLERMEAAYAVLANDLGIDGISRFMGLLGLGSRTGIDMTGEAIGVLPSQEWKRQRFKRPEQQKWYAGETISVGIGQGYNAYTPLQLAGAIATIANNGVMFRPHIVNYVEDIRTRERSAVEPNPLRTLDLKPEHLAFIQQALVGVNKEGTGARAFPGAGYVSAGKTGTARGL